MTSFRYFTAIAALASGALLVPPGAAGEQPPGQSTRRPVVAAQPGVPDEQGPPGQRRSWDEMGLRGFSVALVVGDLAGTATPDNLPAGAKRALSDMRDFLPYKSYRLLDTHWILCCSGSMPGVAGRLRGAEEEEYSFSIMARPNSDGSELAIHFSLREAGASANTVTRTSETDRARATEQAARERDEAARRAASASQADQAAARAQYEEMKRFIEVEQAARATTTASRSRQVLDSTFSMKVGETVVIGTSRLKGDKALIALLTAAPRNTTPSAR
jgi:hypothetical protein